MISAVLINIPSQNELSKKHCFGDCGKIICAGLDLQDLGSAFICSEYYCPHEEIKSPIVGELDREPVVVRKLK